MATSTPQSTPQAPNEPSNAFFQHIKNPLTHNVALVVTPIALGAMFLPPRKFDPRLVILGGCALWGIEQLRTDYTGKTFRERFSIRAPSFPGTELPEKAQIIQAKMREEKAQRELMSKAMTEEDARRIQEQRRQQEKGQRGTLESIWMGDADEDWKAKREQKEKEAFQEGGGGVWGLISDQIFEVFSGKKEDEDQSKDEPKKSS